MKKFCISLAVFSLIPIAVFADQVVNLPYNYLFSGSVFMKNLSPSQCVATDANKKFVSSGGACGGGGGGVNQVHPGTNVTITGTTADPIVNASGGGGAVSSVTAGPSANLTFSPTTGAVIGDIKGNPTFANSVTSPLFRTTATGAGSLSQALQLGSTAPGGYSNLLACPSGVNCTIAGNVGTVLALTDSSSIPYFVVDSSKGLTVTGAITSNKALAPAFVSTNNQFAQWRASTADVINLTSNGTHSAGGVLDSAFGISDPTNGFDLMTLSTGGDVGFRLGVHAASFVDSGLAASSSVCTDGSSQLSTSGCANSPPLIPLGVNGVTFSNPAPVFDGSQIYYAPVGAVIGHINITCAAFNAADVAAGKSLVYSPLNAAGLGGGTANFGIQNATHSSTSLLSLGSVVMPTSPQAGPWVTSVTSTVGTPYTILPGDDIVILITSPDVTTAQWVSGCFAYASP